MRTCSKCGIAKEDTEFYRKKLVCRVCEKERYKVYYASHKDEYAKRSKSWASNNKDKMKEHQKKYYSKKETIEKVRLRKIKNKEKNSEYQKEYRKIHADWIKERIERWRVSNFERVKESRKKRMIANPEKEKKSARNSYLKAKFGMTVSDYDRMCKEQNNSCAICGKDFGNKLQVDHDHNTGKVRGLLCGNCNRALGIMYDSETLLQNAIEYLRKNK